MKKRIYYYTFLGIIVFFIIIELVEYFLFKLLNYNSVSTDNIYLIMFIVFIILIGFLAYYLPKYILKNISSTMTQLIKQLDVINYPEETELVESAEIPELLPAVNTIYELRQNLKSYIKQLEDSEKVRREFSANVSHELKTPLTTIKGFGEMLEQGLITNEEDINKYGGIIFRESTRLLSLIDDIIQLSKIENNTTQSFTTFKIMPIVRDCIEILTDKADKNSIKLSLRGEENIRIKGNSLYFSELIINVIDNAIKYNRHGGNVWISVFEDEENAIISIKDDGIGIKEQYHNRIFERFYRVDKSHSKAIGGTGLGLAIVKHVVTLHNGTIQLFSKPGKGTELIVRIPKKKSSKKK